MKLPTVVGPATVTCMEAPSKYQRIERGTRVRVLTTFRTAVSISGPDAFAEWEDHPAGLTGTVYSVSNAGFRGIEHQVVIDGPKVNGRTLVASHLAAAQLEVI